MSHVIKACFKIVGLLFLSIVLIDGAFDYNGFDPWDNSPDVPSGFFGLLRIFICIICVIEVFDYSNNTIKMASGEPEKITLIQFGFIIIFIIFQPVFTISFDYKIWLWIDLVVLLYIIYNLIYGHALATKINKLYSR